VSYDFLTATPASPTTQQTWDDAALLAAYWMEHHATRPETREATGLSNDRIHAARDALTRNGWLIEIAPSLVWGKQVRTWVLRPPGKQPCPECGSMMRSTNPHYQCEVCHDKRIAAGKDIWPWEEGY
jgi:hypothetical protein